MSSTTFDVMILLPSFAFAFAVLASFYGARRAYVALSWVPVALLVTVCALQQASQFLPHPPYWSQFRLAVGWAALIQGLFGVLLAARAAWRGQSCIGLLLATCLAGVPYLLRV